MGDVPIQDVGWERSEQVFQAERKKSGKRRERTDVREGMNHRPRQRKTRTQGREVR